MANTKKTLGKGLASLLSVEEIETASSGTSIFLCPIEKIKTNPNQPRKHIDEEALAELANSIKEKGILQPLLVRDCGDYYELIAGERRWRAAQIAGLQKVPVLIKNIHEIESLEIALIENIQREDLNPIDEALAYKKLTEELGLTQEEIAKKVGKNRSTIANTMRLLELPEICQDDLKKGRYTQGHARAILMIDDYDQKIELRNLIIKKGLSVRQTEELAKLIKENKTKNRKENTEIDPNIKELSDRLTNSLGTKVVVSHTKKGGKIEIHYKNLDELERILELLQRKII